MSVFQIALLIGALVTAVLSWHLQRALLWIFAGAASFVLSTAYARYGLPYPAAFTAACDVAVCLLVYFFANLKWEMGIGYLFQGSVLLSIGHLIGVIEPHRSYVMGLEGVNWLALLFINTTVVTLWLGSNGIPARRYPRSGVRWAHDSLFQKRAEPPWSKVSE